MVAAERSSDAVVGVAELVLDDRGGAIVGCEDEVGVECDGSESPPGRQVQAVPEPGQAFVALPGLRDEVDRLQHPGTVVEAVEDVRNGAAVDAETGVPSADHRGVGGATRPMRLTGEVE